MKAFTKIMIILGAIALVLLIIIIKIPSHRKLKKLNDKSLSYEHSVIEMNTENKEKQESTESGLDQDSRANLDANRSKGGYSSYEDGTYQEPEKKDTPVPGSDTGNDNPGTTDSGTDNPGTTDPGKTDPNQTEPDKTPTPEPTKAPAVTGKTCKVICEGSVRLRSRPDSSDDHNAVYLAMAGEILDVVSTEVQTDDPVTTEWYLVKKQDKKYNRELYVPAKYVELQ
ncbi:MAG: hypothetical protein IKR27_05770 [Lachnospiraceae bacterium]|nr:hypothetical protein [Lachnospiraceae bacterium]